MRLRRLSKRQWLAILVTLVLYVFGYAAARRNLLLVHRVSYATDSSGARRHFHQVAPGEFGPSIIFRSEATVLGAETFQNLAYWAYLPLRWGEAVTWRLVPRSYPV